MSHGKRRATVHNKRDDAEPGLLLVAQQCGAVWTEAGPLDGWITYRGLHVPVEIKTPGHNERRYQQSQIDFIDLCRRIGAPVFTWSVREQVVDDLQNIGTRE